MSLISIQHKLEEKNPDTAQKERKGKGQVDHYFSSQKPWFSLSKKIWNPPTDIYETKDKLLIKMEVAGVKEEHLDISFQDNVLVIRGLRMEEEIDEMNLHLLEIHYGQFERIFELPDNVKIGEIRATYSEGFLRVLIDKEQLQTKPITISVNK